MRPNTNISLLGGEMIDAALLGLAQSIVSFERRGHDEQSGVNPTEARLLIEVVRWRGHDAIGVRQLALAASIEESVVSKSLKQLERAGLLKRKPCVKDHRMRRVWLTRRGLTLAQRLSAESEARWAGLEERLAEDSYELAKLLATVERLRAALDAAS